MAQETYVMAFRKRMKSFGYADITIKCLSKKHPEKYQVTAVEPLAGCRITVYYNLYQMNTAFRRIRGNVKHVYRDTAQQVTLDNVITINQQTMQGIPTNE